MVNSPEVVVSGGEVGIGGQGLLEKGDGICGRVGEAKEVGIIGLNRFVVGLELIGC